ncbi:pyruvate decarboxylase-like protein [Tothia fuscella]|uniref:Pyruvate decarboxylase n=1 Tax=Tothia fuscella TaxID=1048955 RepID=A0A9P4NXV4_9PEZI|nr:pyruvate decarboxylase-like protein [Tothia fuscella]
MAETNGHSGETIPLGLYLWTRIRQIGVSTILGVPGDFNLEILDYIYQVPDLTFLGNSNELNAAYSADGYARVREGAPGVFITTHGVGEMSAINGVLGSLSESIPVIHVVGQTSKVLQEGRLMIHHSIGNSEGGGKYGPDHQMYAKMSKSARVAEASLWEVEKAPGEIDRVIRECVIQRAPVYIFMPLDLSMEEVPRSLLDTPIDLSLPIDTKVQTKAVDAIISALTEAKNPALFVDGLVQRHGAREECKALAKALNITTYTANMGKGVIDETEPYFAGMYGGVISDPELLEAFEKSDCVLLLGNIAADTNSGGLTRKFEKDEGIQVNANNVVVKGQKYEPTFIKPILAELKSRLADHKVAQSSPPQALPKKLSVDHKAKHLTQSWIWSAMMPFFQPNDVIVAETGTTSFGIIYQKLPPNVKLLAQTYYGSIGWATPATLGAELALEQEARESGKPRGRTVLITGDGSMQLTMQEIGTMLTARTKPIIIILNNAGYTIERVIHGARQKYNDINAANYAAMLHFFCHPSPEKSYHKATTKEEFKEIFGDERYKDPQHLMVIEIVLDKFDVPWRLTKQISIRGERYMEELVREGFIGEGRVGVGG